MHIRHLVVRNFRALEDIEFDLISRVNVIVGPNAVGKTTILQSVRLVKALLAPRSQNEAQQTLISLSAASPHFPQRLRGAALARDASKPVEIRASFVFTATEVDFLESERTEIVQSLVTAQLGLTFQNPASLIQFFASEQGKRALDVGGQHIDPFLRGLRNSNPCTLGLTMDVQTGQIGPVDPLAGIAIAYIDGHLPPHTSIFSYFPADRALPVGETPVQLGAADIQQQLESHNSQPQLKYSRLKNMIFNTIVLGESERASFQEEFQRIFDGMLRGKEIGKFGINEIGLLSVNIKDTETGRITEIDSLSSGEKNLILTFLLIAKSVSDGGIVLFDEPELHLNPSVCKELLHFIIEAYADRNNLQFIICTHSPEILISAFDTENCALFHLKTAANVSRVGRRALDEYADALQKLGTSVGEALLYEGTILVEGDEDADFLRAGFGEFLRKYNIKDRGGRKEVEKTAKKLQELEARGDKVSPISIILDKDDEITDIKNSPAVRILQWQRRCMDNYFLDIDVITELLKDDSITETPITSSGDVDRLLRGLAFDQLSKIAAREVYQSFGYESPWLRAEDLEKKSESEIGAALYARMRSSKNSMPDVDERSWVSKFHEKVNAKKAELKLVWEPKWKEVCDGKRLFVDLQKKGILKISVPVLKRKIIQRMKETKSENWRLVESQLKTLIENPQ
ncbi:MAG: AAA family ATPase [Terriglobia bacterium]|jgi:predicted ATPase